MPPGRAAPTDEEWDFSEFTVRQSLTSTTEAPYIDYGDLRIVGALTSETKDYVTEDGVHYNGATKSGQRFILYTPSVKGRLMVSYKSNGSTARGCYISEEISTTNYVAMDSAVVGSVVAQLRAGVAYYICCDAGITITNIIFTAL